MMIHQWIWKTLFPDKAYCSVYLVETDLPNPQEVAVSTYVNLGRGYVQWEFQDPEMEVLYHIRLYFVGIFPEI
jgi:hypothetical protein